MGENINAGKVSVAELVQPLNRTATRNILVPLDCMIKEARGFLNPGQYWHLTEMLKDNLEEFPPTGNACNAPIQILDDPLWQFQETGGLLGGITATVFFAHLAERAEIVLLGAREGRLQSGLARHHVIRMQNRLDYYMQSLAG